MIVGDNLAFKNLKKYIDNQKEREPILLIVWIALGLGSEDVKRMNNWHALWQKHCQHYKREILEWLEFTSMIDQPKRIEISEDDFRLLIEILGGMKQKGAFSNYSFHDLARWMHEMFNTKAAMSSTEGNLKTVDSYLYEKIQEEFLRIQHK